jgi:hypothetical protein
VVFGRLAGYEDHNPTMRWIVGGKVASGAAASPSQMGRFETRWLMAEKNLAVLSDLSGRWIDHVHGRRPPRGIVLDMDPMARRRRARWGMIGRELLRCAQ